jgi:hypothetical protein
MVGPWKLEESLEFTIQDNKNKTLLSTASHSISSYTKSFSIKNLSKSELENAIQENTKQIILEIYGVKQ